MHLGPGDRGGWVSARRLIIGKARQDGGEGLARVLVGRKARWRATTWKEQLLLASMPYVAESRAQGIVSMTSWSRLHLC